MKADDQGAFHRYRFGAVDYNEADECLSVDGQPVAIEPRPLAVLQALLRQPRIVLTKEELLAGLWGRDESILSDNALPNAVSKLRRALGADAAAIRTVAGSGYMFDAPIQRMVVARSAYPELHLVPGLAVPGRAEYRLVRVLGVSARNAVWLAHAGAQDPPRVFKFCVDGPGLAGLKRERTLSRVLVESLGVRDDLVRVLDANFSDAPYWIECEFGGASLAEWADGGGLAALTRAQRLALVVEIARSVADAHSAAVLHGDLKPGNVLLAADDAGAWHCRLTDFGNGWLLEPERLARLRITGLGLTVSDVASPASAAGTALYIAPELLAGQQPSTRSDLFALGVLAWQIIAGDLRAPMAPGWERTIDDALLAEDLAAATHLVPASRPASVANWLERVQSLEARHRALAEARDREARDRLLREREARRRAQRPYAIAAVAALVLALGASLWSWQRTRMALAQARGDQQRAQQIQDFMADDVLGAGNPSRRIAGHPATLDDILAHASERALTRFPGQPRTEAVVHRRLAQVYTALHKPPATQIELERGAAALRAAGVPDTDPDALRLHLGLVGALALQSHFEPAEQLLATTTAQARDALAREPDGNIAYEVAFNTAVLAYMRGRFAQAVPQARRTVELGDKLFADDLAHRASVRLDIAEMLYRAGDLESAYTMIRPLFAPPFDERGTGSALMARARLHLGKIETGRGHLGPALAALLAGRDALAKVVGPDDYFVAIASLDLSDVEQQLGRLDDSLADARRGAEVLHRTVGPDNQATRIADLNLALLAVFAGDDDYAQPRLEEGRRWFVALVHDETHPTVEAVDFHLAVIQDDRGHGDQALKILDRLDAAKLDQGSPSVFWPARLAGERGRALALSGHADAGAAMLARAIADLQHASSPPWMWAGLKRSLEALPSPRHA